MGGLLSLFLGVSLISLTESMFTIFNYLNDKHSKQQNKIESFVDDDIK